MKSKTPSESRMTLSTFMSPQDTNPYGSIHGGVIMHHIDEAAGVVAMRHCRGNVVTRSVDRLDFRMPVMVGELVFFKANVNMVFGSSLEIGVRVEAENLMTGEVRHVASSYLTMVRVDGNRRPVTAPPLKEETGEDARRMRQAAERRKSRLACKG